MWDVLILVVVIIFLFYALSNRGTKESSQTTQKSIPGPQPTDPDQGNKPDIAEAGNLHDFLFSLHEKYGDIASFWLGKEKYVSIASSELFREHSRAYNRPESLLENFEPIFGRESIGYANDDDWKNRRSKYDRLYSYDAIRNYYGIFQKNADAMLAKLDLLPAEEHIPLSQWTFAIAMRSMAQTSFGVLFDDDNEVNKLGKNYHEAMDELEVRISSEPPPKDSPRQQKLEEALRGLYDTMRKVIDYRKKNPPPEGETLLIDVIMETAKTENEALCECVTYLVAGLHTTGYLLVWSIYYLSTHPDVQEKAVLEIKEVLGEENVTPSNVNDLVYLKQILNESMRCGVMAPYAGRFENKDATLGGYHIPAKSPVIHALGVMHAKEKNWKDPKKFDPDRFSPEASKNRPSYIFEPFGIGRRKCPGYRFSYIEGTLVLATLLRRFHFDLVPGQELVPEYRFVARPRDEVWVTVQKRK